MAERVAVPARIASGAPPREAPGGDFEIADEEVLAENLDSIANIDSSFVAFLCPRAFGPERVLALLMPEGESASDTLDLSHVVAQAAGVETVLEDITGLLEAAGCYERRDAAIRTVMPEYGEG
jgi:NAD synthase